VQHTAFGKKRCFYPMLSGLSRLKTVGKIVLAGYTGSMGEDNYAFEDLAVIMPQDWKVQAKKPGALRGHGKSRCRKIC
jgi:hypothetical protein